MSRDMRKLMETLEVAKNPNAGKEDRKYSDASGISTKAGNRIVVDITTSEGPDLKRETPSIGVFVDKKLVAEVTWDEARMLAKAINKVTDIAEFG